MKKRLHLSEQQWLKLRDYNKIIARNIQQKIPADWYLSTEDIEGAVYDSIISLLSEYKEGAVSPTSYCYQYAERRAQNDLMREYRRIKNQLSIDDMLSPVEDEEGNVKSEIGKGDVQALSIDERESGAT